MHKLVLTLCLALPVVLGCCCREDSTTTTTTSGATSGPATVAANAKRCDGPSTCAKMQGTGDCPAGKCEDAAPKCEGGACEFKFEDAKKTGN